MSYLNQHARIYCLHQLAHERLVNVPLPSATGSILMYSDDIPAAEYRSPSSRKKSGQYFRDRQFYPDVPLTRKREGPALHALAFEQLILRLD